MVDTEKNFKMSPFLQGRKLWSSTRKKVDKSREISLMDKKGIAWLVALGLSLFLIMNTDNEDINKKFVLN